MNDFSFPSVLAITAGFVFLYAAVKGQYPQDVIRGLMGKPPIHPPLGATGAFGRQLPGTGTGASTGTTVPSTPGVTVPGQPVVTV